MAEFKKLPTQAELQKMLYMGQLQGKSTQDIINENLARGTTIKALPESFFTTAGAGARQAGQFVNRAGTAQDLAKLFPGYTGQATVPIPTSFNFAGKMDPYSGQVIPGGLQTQQIPYGDILKAIKPADVLGLTGTAQAYSDIGAGKAPSPMDVLDTVGLGAVMAKPAQLGFKAGKGLLEATNGLPVGMSIKDVSKTIINDYDGNPVNFYHGGNEEFSGIKPKGRFGNAIFVKEGSPSGYGTNEQIMNIRGGILELDQLQNEIGTKKGKSILSKALGGEKDPEKLDAVALSLTDGSHYPTDKVVLDAIGAIDEADAQIEIQKLRGNIARSLGHSAVRTPDEFDGKTVMILNNDAVVLPRQEKPVTQQGGLLDIEAKKVKK